MSFFRRLCLGHVVLMALSPALLAQPNNCVQRCVYPSALKQSEKETLQRVQQYWQSRPKYFLSIGISNIDTAASEDYAATDANTMADLFCSQGFKPLGGSRTTAVLTRKQATSSALNQAIENMKDEISWENPPLVVVYFSGHGVADTSVGDLRIALADSKRIEPLYMFSVADFVRRIRLAYDGELVIIFDTCYAGAAQLTNVERANGNDSLDPSPHEMAILTSSSKAGRSYAINAEPLLGKVVEQSAYTAAFLAAWRNVAEIDPDGDGIITLPAPHNFARVKLKELFADPALRSKTGLTDEMAPSPQPRSAMIAFACESAKRADTIDVSIVLTDAATLVSYQGKSVQNDLVIDITSPAGRPVASYVPVIRDGKVAALTKVRLAEDLKREDFAGLLGRAERHNLNEYVEAIRADYKYPKSLENALQIQKEAEAIRILKDASVKSPAVLELENQLKSRVPIDAGRITVPNLPAMSQ